ncbi:MAG: RibD family protein, partial [Porticoccus sp.]
VVDSQLKMPIDAKLLSAKGPALKEQVLIATACDDSRPIPIEGAEVVCLAGDGGQVDLTALLKVLAEKECNRVLVEAGAELAGAFLQAGLVDEFVIYMAPKLLGSSARPLLTLPFDSMDQQIALDITDMRQVGDDIRITARPAG